MTGQSCVNDFVLLNQLMDTPLCMNRLLFSRKKPPIVKLLYRRITTALNSIGSRTCKNQFIQNHLSKSRGRLQNLRSLLQLPPFVLHLQISYVTQSLTASAQSWPEPPVKLHTEPATRWLTEMKVMQQSMLQAEPLHPELRLSSMV